MAWHIVDVAEAPGPDLDAAADDGPLIAVGALSDADESTLRDATFTLTEEPTEDRRAVTVTSIDAAVAEVRTRVDRWPQAAAVCDDVLRSVDVAGTVAAGLVSESQESSPLQSRPHVAHWMASP